ncbi:MAG: hypothetical protein O3C27_05705 [Actinomycetota bacterium]|nr:hypothetical protein [Actinomycetota bacterium]
MTLTSSSSSVDQLDQAVEGRERKGVALLGTVQDEMDDRSVLLVEHLLLGPTRRGGLG